MKTKAGSKYRDQEWVSKTDIIRFDNCPYAFWLVDKGDVRLEDVMGEFRKEFVQQGIGFERDVRSAAFPLEIPPEMLPILFEKKDMTIFGVPMMDDESLHIYGRPDGIKTEHGQLVPIEIKSHKIVRRTDRLELAFYWLLLERYRTQKSIPRGVLILRGHGGEEIQEFVDLTERDIETVTSLIEDVRSARVEGVKPAICTCEVCSTRPEIGDIVKAHKGTTLIYGIAAKRARLLNSIGVKSLEDIVDCDEEAVARHLVLAGHSVSERMVRTWKHHVTSYVRNAPFVFGDEPFDIDSFIALDLEYVAFDGGFIWLVGVAVVKEGVVHVQQWWGDDDAQIAANLRRLADLVRSHPDLPVLTWAGNCAEVPQLEKAAVRFDLVAELQPLMDLHHDLFVHAERNVRFPIPTLELKAVGAYLGIPRRADVRSGMEADMLYRRYRKTTDSTEKTCIKQTLMDYNRDDVLVLAEVAMRLRAFGTQSRGAEGNPVA